MRNLQALAWGFVGTVVALLLYGAWVDHQRLTALWNLAVQQEQARQQALAQQGHGMSVIPDPPPTAKK